MVHGIYAADSRRLSVKAAFPAVWEAEEKGGGSVVRGFLTKPIANTECDNYELGSMVETMKNVAVYSFKDGLRTITDALVRELKSNPKVQLQSGVGVTSLRLNPLHDTFEVLANQDDNMEVFIQCAILQVTTTSNDSLHPTHVVSTLPLPVFKNLLPPSTPLPHLEANPYSSVTVVNLVFSSCPSERPLHPPGFGYLIPRPMSGYDATNPGILGTVFDSSALSRQDRGGFTKLTVMLGGPHPLTESHTSLPVIMKHLSSHLSRALPDPLLVRVHSQASCIPTLTVGHLERMGELKAVLAGAPWEGRLEVVGSGVGGVSVGDCVEAGKRVGKGWV